MAEKYDIKIYAMDQDRDKFAGFFQESERWKYGDCRWSGKRGAIYVPGGGTIELEFHCRTPGVEEEPVVVTVFHDGRVLDRVIFGKQGTEDPGEIRSAVTGVPQLNRRKKEVERGKNFTGQGTVRRKYELPVTPGKTEKLILEVSRTWIPHEHLGNFDRRKLGIGVKVRTED